MRAHDKFKIVVTIFVTTYTERLQTIYTIIRVSQNVQMALVVKKKEKTIIPCFFKIASLKKDNAFRNNGENYICIRKENIILQLHRSLGSGDGL
jgi:hypothetical protein